MATGALEQQGHSWKEIRSTLAALKRRKENLPWHGPRKFRPSYFAGEDVVEVATKSFNLFLMENWLYGRTSFPALGQLEDEVLATLVELFGAPASAGGILTSGGTESLILSVKVPRNRAQARGLREPFNIVVPWTAHPAFDKAGDLLHLEVRRAPASPSPTADVEWMHKVCDERTIMLVG